MKKLLVFILIGISLSLSACAGKSSSAEPGLKPDASSPEKTSDISEDTPQKYDDEYRSYQVEPFEAETAGDVPSESEKPALKSLNGDTYDAQCAEIVNMFFEDASLIRYGAPSSDLMLLIGGNQDLFQALAEPGELLCGSYSFTSELTLQDCGADGAGGKYYVNLIETRGYDEEDMGTHEYGYTFHISINGPADYCITGIDCVYNGPVDNSYEEPGGGDSGGGATGSFVSIYDDEDGIYDGPPDDAFRFSLNEYQIPELEAQSTYGANAQIAGQAMFFHALEYIKMGDYYWALSVASGGFSGGSAVDSYQSACETLEDAEHMIRLLTQMEYTEIPLYQLAQYRYLSAVLVWGID